MISAELARQLRARGVQWEPRPGDRFMVDEPEMSDSIFWVSDFTIEVHQYEGQRVLGFNGTTEWALDSVPVERCLWLPREDQLRELLGSLLLRLERTDDGWIAVWSLGEHEQHERGTDVDEAYAAALLAALS